LTAPFIPAIEDLD
jgi:hypothetical protein